MIGRANQTKRGGAPSADLLVCFPSRAHLTLIPKKVLSPARLTDPSFHRRHRSKLKRLPSTRLGSGLGQKSSPPDSWDKGKRVGSEVSEPNSPKVTCAGQIKVRPRSAAANCKSWQSVMEEIERIHKKSKNEKKKESWGDALGIKKEVMQFLTCLRNVKLDFRCFGNIPESDLSSDDEDEEQEAETHHNQNFKQADRTEILDNKKDSKTVFSNWYMVLQDTPEKEDAEQEDDVPLPPPSNALLLMRCRSAPTDNWLENKAKLIVEQEERNVEENSHQQKQLQVEDHTEEENVEDHKCRKKLRDYLFVMDQYDAEFYKLSTDIAKETWVVGSINPFSRSRSWKR